MNKWTLIDLMNLWEREYADGGHYTDTTLYLCRNQIARRLGCSYSTANRLVSKAMKQELLQVNWTHQHQSYWEGWFHAVEKNPPDSNRGVTDPHRLP